LTFLVNILNWRFPFISPLFPPVFYSRGPFGMSGTSPLWGCPPLPSLAGVGPRICHYTNSHWSAVPVQRVVCRPRSNLSPAHISYPRFFVSSQRKFTADFWFTPLSQLRSLPLFRSPWSLSLFHIDQNSPKFVSRSNTPLRD